MATTPKLNRPFSRLQIRLMVIATAIIVAGIILLVLVVIHKVPTEIGTWNTLSIGATTSLSGILLLVLCTVTPEVLYGTPMDD